MKVRKKVVVPLNTGNRRKIDIRTNYLGVKNLEILSEIFIGFFIDRFFFFFCQLETGKKVGIVVEKGDSYKKKGDSCKITISDFFPSKI